MSESNGLPSGWVICKVKDIMALVNGLCFKKTQWKDVGLPIIRIQNLNNTTATFNYCPEDLPDKYRVRDGDLLFAWSGTPGTSFGAHVWRRGDGWLNQHIFKIEFDKSRFDTGYLRYAVNDNLNRYIQQAHGGAGLAHITKGQFEESGLRIAPYAEQCRIVSKIEELFSDLDAGVAALERVKANLKRYRTSVLKAAVEGNLTEQWRADHPDTEPADQLLQRILTERRRKWEADQLAKYEAKGKKPPKGWKDKYKEPAQPDTSKLPKLPEGWCWATIDMLISKPLRNGHSARATSDPNGIRTFTLTAVTYGDFSESNTKLTIADPGKVQDLWVQYGDILIERSNTPELVGTARLYKGPSDFAIFPDLIIRVRVSSELSNDYIGVLLLSPHARSHFHSHAKGLAGTMPKIDQQTIIQLPIPLPPLHEQQEIAALVELTLSQIVSAEMSINRSTARATRLRQSILKRAFEGKLVPQDPADEPAEVLLARIAEQRAKAEPKKKPTRKKPRRKRKAKQAQGA